MHLSRLSETAPPWGAPPAAAIAASPCWSSSSSTVWISQGRSLVDSPINHGRGKSTYLKLAQAHHHHALLLVALLFVPEDEAGHGQCRLTEPLLLDPLLA